ncbi:mitochondrial fission factor homolog B isoform X1 [Corythoichthys intestinalis]|uniref:mitochondrial fission factor homolog B isoform X1 n=1 Tax=Corythoichthys intestinalis TaxID=161448 RepID=UPI0025A5823E|nr:mitochondrial fission factor homolog B isoform X1 [Corythoichthys intestinalis]XP_057695626.1 mitochondrial fission factor homolog B isoform X1 [Corythoichthys intestinalis]XP_061797283.1 mitochondrial fission factor-like isoform X1 [Nerophis lumbriciformis]
MSSATFPSPIAEMAEINRIHYDLEYTEGISQRMRIPEMLKVAPQGQEDSNVNAKQLPHSVTMQVPERIVVSGDGDDKHFSRPRDLDLIQSTPLEALSLKTPPRVLTLSERPLDFLEDEHRAAPENEAMMRHQGRSRRERSASENTAVRHTSQLMHHDSAATASPPASLHPPFPPNVIKEEHNLYSASGILSFLQSTTRRAYQQVLEVLDENRRKPSLRGGSASSTNPLHDSRIALATYEGSLDGGSDDMTVVDAATLRRQLIKLNRRLQLLEEENKERAKREMILYSVTVAFWLINTWVWLKR